MVREALDGLDGCGLQVEYRLPDGRKVRQTLVQGKIDIIALLYADELVFTCESMEVLKECMRRLEVKTRKWGLTINAKKTKWMVVNGDEKVNARLEVGGEPIERLDRFVYLGSLVTEKCTSGEETRRRIGLGAFKFHQLRKAVWEQAALSTRTKAKIYRATVLSTVLY